MHQMWIDVIESEIEEEGGRPVVESCQTSPRPPASVSRKQGTICIGRVGVDHEGLGGEQPSVCRLDTRHTTALTGETSHLNAGLDIDPQFTGEPEKSV